MLNLFLCWFLGHRFVEKVHAGAVTKYFFGDGYQSNKYKWETVPFCTRCGKTNSYYEGKE